MGGVISSETDIASHPILRKFVGNESISDQDPFWNQLLSFNLKLDLQDHEISHKFDTSVVELLQSLMYNTQKSGNFSALIRVFLRRTTELRISEQCDNKIFLWQTANCLTILVMIFKFLTERMNEIEFVRVFSYSPIVEEIESKDSTEESDQEDDVLSTPETSPAEDFLLALITVITELPVTDLTLSIHVEAAKCLLALISSQLYSVSVPTNSLMLNYMLKGECGKMAPELTKILLLNYLNHNEILPGSRKEAGSLVLGFASSVWSMVQMVTGLEANGDEEESIVITLGSISSLLLLVLSCHQTEGKQSNPYATALAEFQNSQEISSLSSSIPSFKLPFTQLYDRFCDTVNEEPPMLLLYLLLYRNSGFRNFVLSRINLENLILPVLRVLHDFGSQTRSNSHHMYLAVIVLLILSEDEFFSKVVHESMVKDVSWYDSETPLSEISLGGLMALVLLRLIYRNAIKTKDRYLHTNCLAVLANMSSSFKQLNSIVCQKLIGLLEMLTKRQAKMVDHMKLSAALDVADGQPVNFHDDITALECGIRTLLEIINSTFTSSLRFNSQLIYATLYHRSLFDGFTQHPMFQDLMPNISAVIAHFSSKVVHLPSGDGAAIMDVISKEVIVWPTDRLAKFPELKFRYVEDDNTAEFFIPYVWRLVLQHGDLRIDAQRVKLFNALLCS